VTAQTEAGIRLIGHFTDRDDPDRFVWLRGFESMEARVIALASFYGGAVWRAHRDAANATMLDSDNVLLLHLLDDDWTFALGESGKVAAGLYNAVVHYIRPELMSSFVWFFDAHMRTRAKEWGGHVIATFRTELGANGFPQLPVRTGESAFVWFVRHATEAAEQSFWRRARLLTGWREGAPEALLPAFMRKPEIVRLSPTAGSPLK
jgi:hypothetical protein